MTVAGEISYYLRPVNGDDSNDGTSFATAWKTWARCMELTGVSGATAENAALFLVNEGGPYTGPWHDGSVAMDELFSEKWHKFSICGMSADGSFDNKTHFEFDLSGYTFPNWFRFFSDTDGISGRVSWRNVKWSGASMDSWVSSSYYIAMSSSRFIGCIFEDNDFNYNMFQWSGNARRPEFRNCVFRRNNSYGSACLFQYNAVNTTSSITSSFQGCIFEENQTKDGSSNYVIISHPLPEVGIILQNCAFYNNGKDTDSVCVHLGAYDERGFDLVSNNIFFNNAGTAIYCRGPLSSDADYGNSFFGQQITENVFAYNNKAIDFLYEPGIRFSTYHNNVFYNNTVDDIPDTIEGLVGMTGANFVFDPQFNNGYSGDFSVPHDSRLYTESVTEGTPIGGSFVQRRLFTTTTSGSLSLGTADVGDTVTVSGKSYQKVNQNPPVWRRFITQPPLTGTFSPSSLASLYGWYDASTDVTVNGTDVTQWTDKSGTGNHLSTSGYPTLVSSGQNGLDIIRIADGNNIVSQSSSYNSSPWHAFFVVKPDKANWLLLSDQGIIFILAASSASTSSVNGSIGGTSPTFYLNGDGVYQPANRGIVHQDTNGEFNIIGISSTDIDANLSGSAWRIGQFPASSAYNFAGDIAEIVILNSDPTSGERRKIEGYLAHKWGLASKLPSTHPFKNYAP